MENGWKNRLYRNGMKDTKRLIIEYIGASDYWTKRYLLLMLHSFVTE